MAPSPLDINSQEKFGTLAVFLSFLVTVAVILAASSALEGFHTAFSGSELTILFPRVMFRFLQIYIMFKRP